MILGYARILIDMKRLEILEKMPSSRMIMLNSDAIIFAHDKSESIAIQLSKKSGDLKNEFKDCKEILKFYALNPRCYHLTYESDLNIVKQVSRVSGFSLRNVLASPTYDNFDFDEFLKKALQNEDEALGIDQIRTKNDLELGLKTHAIIKFYLRNTLTQKRIVLNNFTTKPFGFLKK